MEAEAEANWREVGVMPVSETTYLRLIAEDPDHTWELHRGRLWSKDAMTWEHADTYSYLGFLLQAQLDRREFIVHIDAGHLHRSETQYYVPDLIVVPREMARRLFAPGGVVEVYREPLPLVVEVWSPSTGRLDVDEKVPEYQRRGDLEIWRIHPYQRTLISWVRHGENRYDEIAYRGGIIRPAALPNVHIDLDALFDAIRLDP